VDRGWRALWRAERGASGPEYALVVALVALVAVGGWALLGDSVGEETRCVAGAIGGSGAPCAPGREGRAPRSVPPTQDVLFASDPALAAEPAFDELGSGRGAEYRRADGPLATLGEGDRHAFDPSDIDQGEIGNCTFLASLAALANANPEVLEDAIRDNGDDTFTVTFHVGDATQEVTVSRDVPMRDGKPIFAAVGDPSPPLRIFDVAVPFTDGHSPEIWPPMFEKAYAQLLGSYNKLAKGTKPMESLSALTGESEWHPVSDVSFDSVASWIERGQPVIVGSLTEAGVAERDPMYQDQRLITKHAYYAVGVDRDRGKIILQNPWEWNSWDGHPLEISFEDLRRSFSSVTTAPRKPVTRR